MARLRQLIDAPTVSDERRRELTEVSADDLVDLVLDDDEPWWRRRNGVRALAGRVPDSRAMDLVGCVQRREISTEIRKALLVLLAEPGRAHGAALLAWLREQEHVAQRWLEFTIAILRARADLGDLLATGPLAEMATEPWAHRRVVAESALDTLIEEHGLPAVLTELGADSPRSLLMAGASAARRLLGLRLVWRTDPAGVIAALADPARTVARAAYDLLTGAEQPTGTGMLARMAEADTPGHLWALAVLCRRGDAGDRGGAVARLARTAPRVELPGVPADVRQAIVRRHAPGQAGTDPRWLVEAACLDPAPEPGRREPPDRAAAALTAAGLPAEPPIAAADEYGQGHDTYSMINTAAGCVRVSTLGPFFTVRGEGTERVVAALRAAGFRHIDETLARTEVTGLCVYHFGDRGPLTVGKLLFYWQD